MLKVMYEATELAGYSLQQHIGEKVTVFARLMTAGFDTRSLGDEFDTSATANYRKENMEHLVPFYEALTAALDTHDHHDGQQRFIHSVLRPDSPQLGRP
ncbi:hypothetical protein VTH82DRAFT_6134 [Thermothelomyces myriococcoides]